MGATISWWKPSLSQLNSWRICLGIQKIWNYLLGAGFQTFERVPVSPLLKGFFGAIYFVAVLHETHSTQRLIEMMLLRKLRHLCWADSRARLGRDGWWKAIWGGNSSHLKIDGFPIGISKLPGVGFRGENVSFREGSWWLNQAICQNGHNFQKRFKTLKNETTT